MTIDMTFERRLELATKNSYNDGIEKGSCLTLINCVIKKIKKQKNIDVIAEEMEEDIECIRPIYNTIMMNLDMNAEQIYDILHSIQS